ncbi:MAG: hypothetical protein A2X23_11045 [Chloroflexi bacterium GWC2_73_18]|nr:MAG: hypothetical protein A2X23_11045 [Chloroflexi bacterium GWC2_73_18]
MARTGPGAGTGRAGEPASRDAERRAGGPRRVTARPREGVTASAGAAAEAARAEFRAILEEKGHAVDLARRAMARLERAFAEEALARTPFVDRALADLRAALDQVEGQKLGGKSAEASRFILRAIARMLDEA